MQKTPIATHRKTLDLTYLIFRFLINLKNIFKFFIILQRNYYFLLKVVWLLELRFRQIIIKIHKCFSQIHKLDNCHIYINITVY